MKFFALFIFSSLTFALSSAKAACGKFVVVKGTVQVDFAKEKRSDRARVGTEVCAGDSIAAKADSRAKIKMVDNNELNISPDTVLKIATYDFKPEEDKKKVLLDVLKGKVRSTVKQKYDGQANTFQVKTKAAVAGVRGTDFVTAFDPSVGRLEVVTFEGKVEVGQMSPSGQLTGTVGVTAGQMTGVTVGQAPETPKPVPATELKQMNSETQASTTTPNDKGESGARQPASASEEPKKDSQGEPKAEPKTEPKSGAKSDGAQQDAPRSPASPSGGTARGEGPKQDSPNRSPSSVGPNPGPAPAPVMFDRAADCVSCAAQPNIDMIKPPVPPMVNLLPPPIPGQDLNLRPDFMNQAPPGTTNLNITITTQ